MSIRNTALKTPMHLQRGKSSSSLQRAIAVAAGLLVANGAVAQQQLEQIIVTAQKRSQNLQVVPASISAFTGAGLEKRQIFDIETLQRATPNVSMTYQSGPIALLGIRGVVPDGTSPLLEGTVALHVDGVYQPRVASLQQLMNDLESVEVLRGPQGTLYGRNANAGVISFNTAKPTDEFEASGTIIGGSYKRMGGRGYVSGPLNDMVSMRLSGMYDRADGWGRNVRNGERLAGWKNWGLRLSTRIKPTETVTADLVASLTDSHSTEPFYLHSAPASGLQPNGTLHNYSRLLAAGGDGRYTLKPHKAYQNFRPETNTKTRNVSAIVAWEITPDIGFKSTTGFQDLHTGSFQDIDGTPTQYVLSRPWGDSDTWSQEFNLSANLWEKLDLVLGLYYLEDNVSGGNENPIPPGNPFGSAPTRGLYLYNVQDQKAKSTAGFIDATFNVTDRFRVLAGVRRTKDEREVVQQIQTFVGTSPTLLLPPPDGPGTNIGVCGPNHHVPDLSYKSTTWKGGMQFDFMEDVMGYVTWQEGFKAGGYNQAVCNNEFEPEKIEAWEVGIKSTLLDGRVSLNLSYFDYDYTNMQLTRTINLSPTVITSLIDNAATSDVKGFEIETMAQLLDTLSFDAGIGYLDGTYGELAARNGAVPGNPLVVMTGNTLPRAPEWTINAGVTWTIPMSDIGEFSSRAEYAHTSKQYFTPFNEDIAMQGAYDVVNLILTLELEDSPLSVRAYAKNLFDEAYKSGGFTSGIMFFARGNWAPPRTYGLEVTAKF